MYIHRDWEYRDSSTLLSYMNKTNRPLRDRSGRKMSGEQVEEFIEKSNNKQYSEQWIFSPRNGDELTPTEISIAVRKTMREHLSDGTRATYCFSVHTDEENSHAHIAMTGKESDMMVDAEGYERLREVGARETREVERDRRNGREIEEERRAADRACAAETERARRIETATANAAANEAGKNVR